MELQGSPSGTIQGTTKGDGPVLAPMAPASNVDPAAWLGLPPGRNISHRPDPAIYGLDPAEVGAHAGSESAAYPMQMFRPVNPHAGSEGAPRGMQSDGSPVGDIMQHVFDFERGFAQEGICGLLDMGGMLDRQAAQRELASRFNIFGDDAIGTREQNQVSEQEFQRIAHTYSDIRLGRGDLHLGAQPSNMSDDNYATFRTGAMNDIADILQTESGRTLIGSLHHPPLQKGKDSHRVTTISPNLTEAKAATVEGTSTEAMPMAAASITRWARTGTSSTFPGKTRCRANSMGEATSRSITSSFTRTISSTTWSTATGSSPAPTTTPVCGSTKRRVSASTRIERVKTAIVVSADGLAPTTSANETTAPRRRATTE